LYLIPYTFRKQAWHHLDYPSDHRLVWIDITYENTFGFTMNELVRPQARRLRCNDPRIVHKSEYKRQLLQHQTHVRLFKLQQTATSPMSLAQAIQLENIHREMRE